VAHSKMSLKGVCTRTQQEDALFIPKTKGSCSCQEQRASATAGRRDLGGCSLQKGAAGGATPVSTAGTAGRPRAGRARAARARRDRARGRYRRRARSAPARRPRRSRPRRRARPAACTPPAAPAGLQGGPRGVRGRRPAQASRLLLLSGPKEAACRVKALPAAAAAPAGRRNGCLSPRTGPAHLPPHTSPADPRSERRQLKCAQRWPAQPSTGC